MKDLFLKSEFESAIFDYTNWKIWSNRGKHPGNQMGDGDIPGWLRYSGLETTGWGKLILDCINNRRSEGEKGKEKAGVRKRPLSIFS